MVGLHNLSLTFVTIIITLGFSFGFSQAKSEDEYEPWSRCHLVRHLRAGDAFAFPVFPPLPKSRHNQRHGQGSRQYNGNGEGYTNPSAYPVPPAAAHETHDHEGTRDRKCSWIFQAVDNCTLEFTRIPKPVRDEYDYYDAGDDRGDSDGYVHCREQWFEIENGSRVKRFCGWARPPDRFTGMGKELRLVHFRRHGYFGHREAEAAAIMGGGVVSCTGQREHTTSAKTNTNSHTEAADGDDYIPNCSSTTLAFDAPRFAICKTEAATDQGLITTGVQPCCEASATNCSVLGSLCTILGPAPPASAMASDPGEDCTQQVFICANPSGCFMSGAFAVIGEFGFSLAAPICFPTAQQNCSMVVTLCSKIESGCGPTGCP